MHLTAEQSPAVVAATSAPRCLKATLRALLLAPRLDAPGAPGLPHHPRQLDQPDLPALLREIRRWSLVESGPTLRVMKALLREPAVRQRRPARLLLLYFSCAQRIICRQSQTATESGTQRALALALALGDPGQICLSRIRCVGRYAARGQLALALDEISVLLPQFVALRDVSGVVITLTALANTCCELGWHDRMLEVARMARLVVRSVGRVVRPAQLGFALDELEHTLLWALDAKMSGRSGALAAALAKLQPTLCHARQALAAARAHQFSEALGHMEPLIAWLDGSADSHNDNRQPDADVARALAGPGTETHMKFGLRQLAVALACVDRGQDARALPVLQACLLRSTPGEFIVRIAVLATQAAALSRLGQWQAAYQSLQNADAVRAQRRDEAVHSRLGALLGRLQRDNLLAIGFVGHDLRSPLAAIRTLVDGPPAQRDRALDRIRVLATDALQYTDDYLRYAELQLIDAGSFSAVDLQEVLGDVIDEVRLAAPSAALQIDEAYGAAQPQVHAHFPTVRRIFANLLNNAVQASGEHGHIEVQVSVDGNDAVVAVHDNGPGFAHHLLPALFDDLVPKAHAGAQGHGLGLRFVTRAVHALGGTLFASNREQGGASVYVALPLAAG